MVDKRVDESWKQQVEAERQAAPPRPGERAAEPPPIIQPTPAPAPAGTPGREQPPEPAAAQGDEGMPEARFDLFVTGLAVDALIALGDMAHPATRKTQVNLEHARYLIDLLGMLEEKTRNNLTTDEDRLMKDTLYQLRMRYMAKTGG
jgi:hypothetical protein